MAYRIAGIDVHKKMLAVVVADVEGAMLLDLLVFTNQNKARDNVGVTPARTIESE